MVDKLKPTFLIQDIADVKPDTLAAYGIEGLVFSHARGILTTYNNPEWLSTRSKLKTLGEHGIKFYLFAQDIAEIDVLNRPYNKLPYGTIVDLSKVHEKNSIEAGLKRLFVGHAGLVVVGNWLHTDIRQANEAGYRTALMPERNGSKGLNMWVRHPSETALRFTRGLPVRASEFPEELTPVKNLTDTATIES